MSRTLANRLTQLLETVTNPATGRRWTGRELVNAINEAEDDVSISYSYFSSLKSGSRDNPGLPVLRAIAKVLGVSEAELVTEDSRPALPGSVQDLDDLDDDQVLVLERLARMFKRQAREAARAKPLTPNPSLTSDDTVVASEVDEAVTAAMRALDRFSDRAAAADVVEDLDAALTRFRRYFTASAEQATGSQGTVNAEPESFTRA